MEGLFRRRAQASAVRPRRIKDFLASISRLNLTFCGLICYYSGQNKVPDQSAWIAGRSVSEEFS